ncbi:hypothetical protein FFLO_06896 [Filobasidium floriforme]|uniref:Major facilitator superfamily (MFS) profile domain-containing protein n=1 Tax=Filobasidium floriforme TaxID=5210 RepID=A0A8K0NLP4_9TREE|nr:major facilitator superfamily domain-containing protein [Filobasidium floriforme]KAG7527481.1 hypothetical protein FFLO_06896 [Filobasidium floriforme]KAH8084267.1 major facilitator superfamily domain-containing protein [Filobasidium floriforme]
MNRSYPPHDDKAEVIHVEDGVHDADEHMGKQFANDAEGNLLHVDEAASKRLTRKLKHLICQMDLYVVPIVAIQYLFAFIDRANIGNAKIAGLEKDLGLSGYDYNLLLSVFYISYIAFELPASMFTKWFGPGRAIPLYTIIFGILSIAMAFVTNLGSGCAVRFLLGAAEAGMLPGIAYYLSRWYPKRELAFRLAMYLVCSPLAGAFGGLLASGILKIDSIGSVRSWELIFLIEGIITTGIGIFAWFFMTADPQTARWLSAEEKVLADNRIKREQIGSTVVVEKLNKRGILQGLKNPVVIAIAFTFLLNNISVQGIGFFTPTIVRTIYPNKSVIQQQLHTVPPYIVGAVITVIFPYLSMKVNKRGLIVLGVAPLCLAGWAILLGSHDQSVRYGAIFLTIGGAFVPGPTLPAWTSGNVVSDSSRAAAIGLVAMFGNCGGLISTWTALPSDAPWYNILSGLNLAATAIQIIVWAGILIYMKRDNRARDRGRYDHYVDEYAPEDMWKLGTKQPGFRWME